MEVAFRRIRGGFFKKSPRIMGSGSWPQNSAPGGFLIFPLLIWQGILFAPHLYRPTFVLRARASNERAREWPWVPSMGEPCHGWMISGGTGLWFGWWPQHDGSLDDVFICDLQLIINCKNVRWFRMDFDQQIGISRNHGLCRETPTKPLKRCGDCFIQEEFRLKFLTAEWLRGF